MCTTFLTPCASTPIPKADPTPHSASEQSVVYAVREKVHHLLHILFQGSGQGHVHNPSNPLCIHPHPKGNCGHYNLDFAGTERFLDMLSVLHAIGSCYISK